MDVVGRGVDNGVRRLTLTGSLWAHIGLEIDSLFKRDKAFYHV
jgi:hypothetical protein